MYPSLKPTQKAAIVAAIPPQSATTVQTTAYVDATLFIQFMATISLGAISAGGTVNAQVVQAQDTSGTNVKTAKAIVAMTNTASNSNEQAELNITAADLDYNNGFKFIALQITPSGAAALIGGELIGFDPHYNTADTLAATTVNQIVF